MSPLPGKLVYEGTCPYCKGTKFKFETGKGTIVTYALSCVACGLRGAFCKTQAQAMKFFERISILP
jgi:transcription elongation factor Elf1